MRESGNEERSRGVRAGLGAAAAVLALTTSGRVEAQAASFDGALQLSMQGNLASYQSTKLSSDVAEVSHSDTAFGLASGTGVGAAYGLSDAMLLGLRLTLASTESKTEGLPSSSVTTIGVTPTFEYLFSTEGAVRPFAGLLAGYQRTKTTSAGPDQSVDGVTVGPFAGIHLLASDGFSVDPAVTLTYSAGSSDLGSASLSSHGYAIALSVAFSGWIGTSPTTASPTSVLPARTVTPPAAATPTATSPSPKPAALSAASTPVAPAAAAPAPPPNRVSAPFVSEKTGMLLLTFTVHSERGEAKAILSAQPRKDPQWMDLTLVRTNSAQTVEAACDGMAFEFGGKTYPFVAVGTKMGAAGSFSQTAYDRGRVETQTVHALAFAHTGAIATLCGRRYELPPAFIEQVYDFDQLHQQRAKPGGQGW